MFRTALWMVALIAGCNHRTSPPAGAAQPAPPAAQPSVVELEILELVFRDLLNDHRAGEVCFISLGYHRDRWIDAPDILLRRLADLRLDLRKPSEASVPKLGEMEPDGSRFAPIREANGRRRGSIYYVTIAKPGARRRDSLDELLDGDSNTRPDKGAASEREIAAEFEVDAGRIGGPLDGGGYWAVIRREGGRWVLDKSPGGVIRRWVS